MKSNPSVRQPLLDEEVEAQLMAEMKSLWLRGMPAEVGGLPGEKLKCSEIAEKLRYVTEKLLKLVDFFRIRYVLRVIELHPDCHIQYLVIIKQYDKTTTRNQFF